MIYQKQTNCKAFSILNALKKVFIICILFFLTSGYSQNELPFKIGSEENFSKMFFDLAKGVDNMLTIKISKQEQIRLKVNKRKGDIKDYHIFGNVVDSQSKDIEMTSVFTIQRKEGKVSGRIVFQDQKRAFKISTNKKGEVIIVEEDIDKVVCIGPKIHTKKKSQQRESKEKFLGAVVSLESLPGVDHVIYLDFDGEVVDWVNGSTITANSWGWDNEKITEIWKIVAEDFAPFEVNVTTNRDVFDATSKTKRIMAVFTPTDDAAPSTGGFAYLDSFSSSDIDVCWVYHESIRGAGDTGSHEVGHALGLRHDGRNDPVEVYYRGHNNWAPIMGYSGDKIVGHWSKGEYKNADNTEDDLAIIAKAQNGFGYKVDDHGNDTNSATEIVADADGNVLIANNKGFIEKGSDKDMFAFTTSGGAVNLTIDSFFGYSNLNVEARLLNSNGDEIISSNSEELNASFDIPLQKGTYYIEIDGVKEGDNPSVGYSDYSSLGSYAIAGKLPKVVDIDDTEPPLAPTGLTAYNISQTTLTLSWADASIDDPSIIGYDVYQVEPEGDRLVTSVTTLSYHFTGLTANTTYQFKVKAKDTQNISEFSNTLSVKTLDTTGLNYCTSSGDDKDYYYINRVQLGAIDNTTMANGYSDYTPLSTTTLIKGETHTITVTRKTIWEDVNGGFIAWIDYNKDGDFDDPNEEIFRDYSTKSTASASFTIPNSSIEGNTRMRVSVQAVNTPAPCGSFNSGEVEDYLVVIKNKTDVTPTCNDGIQNGDETGIDCGGSCDPCTVVVVDGAMISTSDDQTAITTITGDGIADVITFKNTSQSSATYAYLITDEVGKILATETSTHDFEGADAGICKVYGISYTGSLSITGKNVSDSDLATESYDLSDNFITVTRENFVTDPTCTDGIQNGDETGIDCGGSCDPCTVVVVDGAMISTSDDQTAITTITGDGIADVITFKNTSQSSTTYAYLITDEAGKILATETSTHDFEGADAGICKVYGISYTGSLSVTGKNVSDSDLATESYDLSDNFITVTRENFVTDPTCTDGIQNGDETGIDCGGSCEPCTVVDGAMISTSDDQTAITTITGDGIADVITFKNTSQSSATYAYLITDEAGKILATETSTHDFEGADAGICKVYGISYTGSLSVTGKNVSDSDLATESYDLSDNFITVTRESFVTDPTCTDGIQNGDETGIDCGGSCEPCDINNNVIYVDIEDKVASASTSWNFFRIEAGDNKDYGAWFSGNTIYLVTYNKDIVCVDATNNVQLLAEGVEVGAASNFVANSHAYVVSSSSYTDTKGKSGYIGFTFKIDDNVHYGWFYVTIADDGLSYTILDYAYNTAAGESLLTTRNTTSSIKNSTNNVIIVYPNPFTDILNIDVSGLGSDNFTMTVYNVLGKIMHQKVYANNPKTITLDENVIRSKGAYLVNIISSTNNTYNKLIIKQ